MKVATIVGTRPELIRLSRVMAALDRYVEQVIIHTGAGHLAQVHAQVESIGFHGFSKHRQTKINKIKNLHLFLGSKVMDLPQMTERNDH